MRGFSLRGVVAALAVGTALLVPGPAQAQFRPAPFNRVYTTQPTINYYPGMTFVQTLPGAYPYSFYPNLTSVNPLRGGTIYPGTYAPNTLYPNTLYPNTLSLNDYNSNTLYPNPYNPNSLYPNADQNGTAYYPGTSVNSPLGSYASPYGVNYPNTYGSYNVLPTTVTQQFQANWMLNPDLVPTTSTTANYPPASAVRSDARTRRGDVADIDVQVPAAAELWFEGVRTKQTGALRRFTTPPLTPGERYAYQVRATWRENGQTVTRNRTIPVRAGEWLKVDLKTAGPGPTPSVQNLNAR
jgi:uncharacterized protein (TIGR03000 family)